MDAIIDAFREQSGACGALGSPFTAALLGRAADALTADREASSGPDGTAPTLGPLAPLLAGWSGDPRAGALPIRFAAALHALVLSGRAPALATRFPPRSTVFDASADWARIEREIVAHRPFIAAWLASPPQTNEVGRSAVLLGGFLTLARRMARPLELLEIGASAGLNQAWDRFHYRLGEAEWGDADSPVSLAPCWEGPAPPIETPCAVVARAACDLAPIGLEDPAQKLRLRAYVWPDQQARLLRLDAAIGVARAAQVAVERSDAADWLERCLARRAPGACTVVVHTIVWQYLARGTRQRIRALLAEVGERATPLEPLAWLRFEFVDPDGPPQLLLDCWPGQRGERLATAHPHGQWVRWEARDAPPE